jgi:hypothetical protein
LSAQVTAVLLVPLTVALNVCCCDGCKDTEVGVSETVTGGFRVMVALADLVGSAVLVAVTVTFCALAIEAGAV